MLSRVAGPHFGNYQAGFRFGQLGYDLIEQRGLRRFQALTYLVLGPVILQQTRHIRAGREMVRRAFEAANKIGDLTCAAYCCNQLNANLLGGGRPLARRNAKRARAAFAQKMRFGFALTHRHTARTHPTSGTDAEVRLLDDERLTSGGRRRCRQPGLALSECWY
jgi:hypothetical protein